MAHPIKSLPAEVDDARFLDESTSRNTSGLPGQGLSEMPLDHNLTGRMEKRLPIVVVVRLAQAERAGADVEVWFMHSVERPVVRRYHPWDYA